MNTAAPRSRALGVAAIAFAIASNIPFATLSAIFEYPDVLRRPAGEVLTMFHAGGAPLILTWHAFAVAAVLLVPLSMGLSLDRQRIAASPALAVGAAVAGSLAGLVQAIGLWRWVFVVPSLASTHANPNATESARIAAEESFRLINLYGGVAIGEHLGQILTALFVLSLSLLQYREGSRVTAIIGFVAAAAIAVGTNEGLAIALGRSGDAFGLVTIAGFLTLTAWLISTGVVMLRSATSALAPRTN